MNKTTQKMFVVYLTPGKFYIVMDFADNKAHLLSIECLKQINISTG